MAGVFDNWWWFVDATGEAGNSAIPRAGGMDATIIRMVDKSEKELMMSVC